LDLTPFHVAIGVLSLLAHSLTDPLLELRLRKVVVIDPSLITGVVQWININALDPSRAGGKRGLQGDQVAPLDDEVTVEPRLLALL